MFQQRKYLSFPGFHPDGFRITTAFMIITGDMENAMEQKEGQPAKKRYACFCSLTAGSVGTYYHIPKHVRIQLAKVSFLHGKGDDIGGLVPVEVIPVETADGTITDYADRKLAVRTSQVA